MSLGAEGTQGSANVHSDRYIAINSSFQSTFFVFISRLSPTVPQRAENVEGFEQSASHALLLEAARERGFG